jgi:hypothetical protein
MLGIRSRIQVRMFNTEENVPAGELKEKNMKKIIFFTSLKSLKKEVGSVVGSRSGGEFISQRYGSADSDPHQNVTDPQHWLQLWYRACTVAVQVSSAFFHQEDMNG